MEAWDRPQIDQLLTRLDELVRWRPGAEGKYLDPHSALARIQGSANHVVLGRRGSGKTRLLDEFKRQAEGQATYVVSVNAEDYKELTYPDILIQILRSFLREFETLLRKEPAVFSGGWWRHYALTLTHPFLQRARRKTRSLRVAEVSLLGQRLETLLSDSEELEAEYTQRKDLQARKTVGERAKISSPLVSVGLESREEMGEKSLSERRTRQKELKKDKVERLLGDFKHLLSGVCRYLNGRVVLAVDDFYFIRREDQPPVIDYIHRICKDTKAFLKVATIKHRSQLFERSDIARGVVAGHEIQTIDLELHLGNFDSITRFLQSIWREVCQDVGIHDPESLFMGDGFRQAVLASGGVPRDFFGVVRTAIGIARERKEMAVGKLRVNEAARQYTEETKVPEISRDAAAEEGLRNLLLLDIARFARDSRKKNCLHIDRDRIENEPQLQLLLDSLVDSRLLHLITDNTSNAKRSGRFAAYLLDVGLYAHPQRRGLNAIDEIEFWVRDDAGRLKNLERSPVYPVRTVEELQRAAQQIEIKGEQVRQTLFPKEEAEELDASGRGARALGTESILAKQLQLLFPPLEDMDSEKRNG